MSASHRSTVLSFSLLLAAVATPLGAHGQSATPQTQASNTSTSQDDSSLRSEVEELKKLVLKQQDRISALETEHKQPTDEAAAATPSPTPAANPQLVPATFRTSSWGASQNNPNAGSSDERIRNLERQIKGIGPINFSGDVRLRGEPFFGGPSDEDLDRARARVRARFNAVADLSEQFRAGISLASGDINDPTSTNQTLTGFYTRKPIGIDQAFVEYKPNWLKNA